MSVQCIYLSISCIYSSSNLSTSTASFKLSGKFYFCLVVYEVGHDFSKVTTNLGREHSPDPLYAC